MTRNFLFALISVLCLAGCSEPRPAASDRSFLPSKNYHYTDIAFDSLARQSLVYVPVYSEIYHISGERRFFFFVTVSARNTSLKDTLYIRTADYYDSQGALQRRYLEKPIVLNPLQSVEFVVENDEKHGGAGANFIIEWGSGPVALRPVFQAVMIGTASQQGLSFTTEGVEIETRQKQ